MPIIKGNEPGAARLPGNNFRRYGSPCDISQSFMGVRTQAAATLAAGCWRPSAYRSCIRCTSHRHVTGSRSRRTWGKQRSADGSCPWLGCMAAKESSIRLASSTRCSASAGNASPPWPRLEVGQQPSGFKALRFFVYRGDRHPLRIVHHLRLELNMRELPSLREPFRSCQRYKNDSGHH